MAKSLLGALPASATLKLPLSAETTSADTSDCGIASLVMMRYRLSNNATATSVVGEGWDQSVGRGLNRTCALHELVLD
ncbi:hypothetical protein DL93DRAFT_2089528 [Clavulina sp. PMI_390]|nr:hypothetical protein DL93DRAFT_2089528 [Clavulina sp. PMI_390]